jgi:site-specific recombinase XerD
MKPSRKRQQKRRRPSLRLPELEHCRTSVLNGLSTAESQRCYRHAINEFIAWYCSEPRLALNRVVVLHYRQHLESRGLASTTINLRLAAVRRVAIEAADCGFLSPDLIEGIRRVKGLKRLGQRAGNWLTNEQGQRLLTCVQTGTRRGKRDAAMLALLLGCGLRRSEVVALELSHFQRREEHWVIIDLVGKGGRIRSVPVPQWVEDAVERWMRSARINNGRLFRAVRKNGRVWGCKLSPNVVWCVVKKCAATCGIDNLAPHDLRRTCARLCHAEGGELEQIQFLLGHASVQTTERYIGCKQKLNAAVNDRLRLWPAAA